MLQEWLNEQNATTRLLLRRTSSERAGFLWRRCFHFICTIGGPVRFQGVEVHVEGL